MGGESSNLGAVIGAEEVKQDASCDHVALFRARFNLDGQTWIETVIQRTGYACLNGDTPASKEGYVSNLFGLLQSAFPNKMDYDALRAYFINDLTAKR